MSVNVSKQSFVRPNGRRGEPWEQMLVRLACKIAGRGGIRVAGAVAITVIWLLLKR